jgi:hypothetical protein
MSVIGPLRVAVLAALSGCTSHTADPAVAPARGGAQNMPLSAAVAAPHAVAPSYEVSIASAQADRVQALEACDSKPKMERVACNREADSAYDSAKAEAEKVRDSTQ